MRNDYGRHVREDGRVDTEDTCHCGASYGGSDHCPACYCEQYESVCDHVHVEFDED